MNKLWRTLMLAALVMAMACPALAESISLDGTVTAAYTYEIYAPDTAQIESIPVVAGQAVKAGDPVAILRTTKIYAEEDGTVAAIFGGVGELTDSLVERYGAAIDIQRPVIYTISASTQYAYDSVDTRLVHVGETVALRSRSETTRTGEGQIVAVEGTGYTVHVTSGAFLMGESVNVYRGEGYLDSQRIGRGPIARNADALVSGSGRIVSLAVKAGDAVKRGDLLMETLTGTGSDPVIRADADGVVAQIVAAQGETVEENGVVAVIWPDDAMQIEIEINENDLAYIKVGDTVNLLFDWEVDRNAVSAGTVTSIASMAGEDSDEVLYRATIAFEPGEGVRYGMSVTVSTVDNNVRTTDAEGSDAQ